MSNRPWPYYPREFTPLADYVQKKSVGDIIAEIIVILESVRDDLIDDAWHSTNKYHKLRLLAISRGLDLAIDIIKRMRDERGYSKPVR